ncbi:hypothetical protein [Sedimentitalea todarodis]|uniref:Type II secretion system protein GspF domain-containing protein n=1 Tax=Sedimentitalea todarodis TaxID=1631240 RepID=A0ABU3VGW1_9RHOB|nr:hypothetical protein [Sedimentitalea todarodis]MDU9004919.1 hypothetical protein [Sedimentitalea todarodis]
MFRESIPNYRLSFLNWQFIKPFLSGKTAQAMPLIPIIGYVVLFNDTIARHLNFEEITDGSGTLFIGSQTRIQLIYFGLVFLGAASFWFRCSCPSTIKIASDEYEYRDFAFLKYSIREFFTIYLMIEGKSGFGKYDDTSFDRDNLSDFVDSAMDGSMTAVATMSDEEIFFALKNIRNRDKATAVHSEMLSAVLDRFYLIENIRYPVQVTALSIFLAISSICLLLPSVDVFVSVLFHIVSAL